MRRIVATLGIAGAAIFGVGGAAQAAYPPGDIGTLTVGPTACEYIDGPGSELEHWEFTADYNLAVSSAVLTIVSDSGDDEFSEVVSLGEGSVGVGFGYSGFESWDPYSGHTVTIEADGQSLSAYAEACRPPGDDGGDGFAEPWLKVWPRACEYDEDDPNVLYFWQLVVDFNAVGDDSSITIQGDEDDFYTKQLSSGEGDFAAGTGYLGSQDWNPFSGYTVTLETGGETFVDYSEGCSGEIYTGSTSGDDSTPGYLNSDDVSCPDPDDVGDGPLWSVTVGYKVTAINTTLSFTDVAADDVLWAELVEEGTGTVTIDSDTPGFEGAELETLKVSLTSPDAENAAEMYISCSSDRDVVYLPRTDADDTTDDASLTGVWVGKLAASNAAQASKASSSLSALPETGANGTALALLGLVLLGSGAALVWMSRRGSTASA